MSYSTSQTSPLKRKKRVKQNSAKNPRAAVTSINSRKKESPNTSGDSRTVTPIRSKIKKIPKWLKSLRILENSSTLLAFCLVCTTLGVYGWTVLSQQTWSRQYRNLENLQRQERDFTAIHESMKNQIAEQAQENSNLIPATPAQSLFIQPAEQLPDNKPSSDTKTENQNLPLIKKPLGY